MGITTPINASVFANTTRDMVMGHPFHVPARTRFGGIPLGVDIFSRRPFFFDPWLLKEMGIIHSTFGLVLGHKDAGKSATMKMVALRLMLLSAGYESARVATNDYKPEGAESEYGALSRVMHSTVFEMARMQVNPLEKRLFIGDDDRVHAIGMVEMAQTLCEFGNDSESLRGHHGTALRIAMYMMLQLEEVFWTPHTFHKLLRSLPDDLIRGYHNRLDNDLGRQLSSRAKVLEGRSSGLKNQITNLVETPDNYNVQDIQAAGDQVAAMLGRVLYGAYGGMFGDRHSLYEMLTQRVITKDWRGILPEAETLMRIIDTRVKMSAIETNRVDLLPHIELDDEKHKAMTNRVYAESHSYFSEIARGVHTMNLSATHRLASIRPGAVGSHLYNLGNTIINNLGFVFIGSQGNDPEVLSDLKARYDFSETELSMIAKLPPHVFAIKLGESEPVSFVKIMATPMDFEVIKSNAATERILNRPDVFNTEDLQRYAQTNGLDYNPERSF
ncbi:hypothetical protein FJZ39_00300 [Candidatus Saccharibacteria bacterium]|nr:hypothetical protein [Candidatus Saccharibacteria bacterium]